MKKNSITTMAVSDADKYNPNDPRSVDSFWEGASIEHKGKVVGIASSAGISSLFGMVKSNKSVSVEEMNVEELEIPQKGDETVLRK